MESHLRLELNHAECEKVLEDLDELARVTNGQMVSVWNQTPDDNVKAMIIMASQAQQSQDWQVLRKIVRSMIKAYYHEKAEEIEAELEIADGQKCPICDRRGHMSQTCWFREEGTVQFRLTRGEHVKEGMDADQEGSGSGEGDLEVDRSDGERLEMEKQVWEEIEQKYKDITKQLEELTGPIKFIEGTECRIETPPGEVVHLKQGKIPRKYRARLMAKLAVLDRVGITKRSGSVWNHPIKVAEESESKEIKLVGQLMALNHLAQPSHSEMPNIYRIMEKHHGSKYFAVINLLDAFWHVKVRDEDMPKTAFTVGGVTRQWRGMLLGYRNASFIFQDIMERVLSGLLSAGVEVHQSSIFIHTKTDGEHSTLIREVLDRLGEQGLRVDRKKSWLFRRETIVQGQVVDSETRRLVQERKLAVLSRSKPHTVTQMRQVLGRLNGLRDYIPNCSERTSCLTNAIIGKKKDEKVVWTEEMDNEWNELVYQVEKIETLKLPDLQAEFVLEISVSRTTIGAALLQKGEARERAPIQWRSQKLTREKLNYGDMEKGVYAAYWAIKEHSHILKGRTFTIETCYKPLLEIRNGHSFQDPRVLKWAAAVMEYDFDVKYVPLRYTIYHNTLSEPYRKKRERSIPEEEMYEESAFDTSILSEMINNALKQDNGNRSIIDIVTEAQNKFNCITRPTTPIIPQEPSGRGGIRPAARSKKGKSSNRSRQRP
ncbi:hypothetical protein NEHOM01_1676 [Nematocida homosporus]|uniref:uncharacterized protein n=1 Tax=Nematocida homosporus TaxID=1912981 RepID=UPI0022210AFF|nr:uncharacterized protein NEHOM01_1676 [Nematocida homosporus]KAI5186745.1 hypothetical protein NEHOM01_1676 [Nematocida homosporus]